MQTNSDWVTIIEAKPRWAFVDFNELLNPLGLYSPPLAA
jgi:hypothetical protein